MQINLALVLLTAALLALRIPLFESVFALILCTPVLAYLLALLSGDLSTLHYYAALVIMLAVLWLNFFKTRALRTWVIKEEVFPLLLFLMAFNYFHSLTLAWPDFIAMGERLRDYAILSSVIQSPINLQEPWLAGFPLNYYAFWYRFGHMLHSIFGLETWQVYHLIQSFTYAFYFACAYRMLNRYLRLPPAISALAAVFICLGSNLAGIKDFALSEPGWWGPSRVIPGAINEFPAWSFLLGDLHPHYLNLPLIPFFVIIFACLAALIKNNALRILSLIAAVLTCPLWIANSNVWEVPVWMLIVGILLTFYTIEYLKEHYINKQPGEHAQSFDFKWSLLSWAGLLAALTVSLFFSRRHIVTPDYPVSLVRDPVSRTALYDLALHFGLPLLVISIGILCSLRDAALRVLCSLMIAYFFFFKEALPFLTILLALNISRVSLKYRIFSKQRAEITPAELLFETLLMFSIVMMLVPELVFLNDPYGAEIERMNTIFKLYSANWFFIHICAFYFIAAAWKRMTTYIREDGRFQKKLLWERLTLLILVLPAFIYGTGFFFVTLDERKMPNQNIEPAAQGLSELERLYPGSSGLIKYLKTLPKGVLLEGQGNPYSYTTMVATLSEHPSYLGWVNHVNLLLSNNPEIARREKLSQEFYTADCRRKAEIMKGESISYVVFGPLEKEKYPSSISDSFSCLKTVTESGQFALYSL